MRFAARGIVLAVLFTPPGLYLARPTQLFKLTDAGLTFLFLVAQRFYDRDSHRYRVELL